MPEPILILIVYVLVDKREKIPEKAIGTAVGVILVVPVAIAALPAWAVYVLAGAAFLLAFWQHKRYWRFYALYTFALVLVLAPPGQAGSEAAHRGIEILIGIALLAVGLTILYPLGTWQSKRHPQPELADNDEPAEPPGRPSPSP